MQYKLGLLSNFSLIILSFCALLCSLAAYIRLVLLIRTPWTHEHSLGIVPIIALFAICHLILFVEYKFYNFETRKYSFSEKGLSLYSRKEMA